MLVDVLVRLRTTPTEVAALYSDEKEQEIARKFVAMRLGLQAHASNYRYQDGVNISLEDIQLVPLVQHE